ncbi:MAG: immunity 26/phosphotriesterase HocA family protein [Alphaproteobacteria bacterium]|nr:immunity 26/phosphotriesterase HocA family protein [Alphaproteobacteria bacterium]
MTDQLKKKRQREKEGQVFKVNLGDGYHSYGRVLPKGTYGLYDIRTKEELAIEEIIKQPVLFKVAVMRYAITQGDFPVVGIVPVEDELKEVPNQFIHDTLADRLKIYLTATGEIRRSSWDEVKDLERCSAYEPENVVERLNDHFAGRSNRYVEEDKQTLERFRPKD